MIDLDKAQDEAKWDPRFKVGGVVVTMAEPSRVEVADARTGLVPVLARTCARIWRVVVGGSVVADLRHQVLGCVEPGDKTGRAAVKRMGAYDLGLLFGAYQKATQRLMVETTGLATNGTDGTDAARVVTPGVEGPLNGGSNAVTLTAGGGRLPGVMGGGPLWGNAWVDANPVEAAKRLRERAAKDLLEAERMEWEQRGAAAAARLHGGAADGQGNNNGGGDEAEHTEVTHGG